MSHCRRSRWNWCNRSVEGERMKPIGRTKLQGILMRADMIIKFVSELTWRRVQTYRWNDGQNQVYDTQPWKNMSVGHRNSTINLPNNTWWMSAVFQNQPSWTTHKEINAPVTIHHPRHFCVLRKWLIQGIPTSHNKYHKFKYNLLQHQCPNQIKDEW